MKKYSVIFWALDLAVLCLNTLRIKVFFAQGNFIYDQESKWRFLVLDQSFNHTVIHTAFFTILSTVIQGTFNFDEILAYQLFIVALIQKSVMLLNSYVLTLIQ